MAGWITAFKVIPWAELIVAAPAVVKGAQKLWATVRKQEAPALSARTRWRASGRSRRRSVNCAEN